MDTMEDKGLIGAMLILVGSPFVIVAEHLLLFVDDIATLFTLFFEALVS